MNQVIICAGSVAIMILAGYLIYRVVIHAKYQRALGEYTRGCIKYLDDEINTDEYEALKETMYKCRAKL